MPEMRNRLASKQSDCCTGCTKPNGENWILCESCQRWTHGGCAGYSNDEYKFLAITFLVTKILDGLVYEFFIPGSIKGLIK